MKIVFFSGTFEPESGGVADYCRLLALQCLKLGHEVACVSLNDRFTSELVSSTYSMGELELPILRLPQNLPWAKRVSLVREFLESFEPNWISLQFVSYAFQDKGIVYPQIAFFEGMFDGYQLHIMFHEIWIGGLDSDGLKRRLVGALQRLSIRRMCLRLRPDVCTTNIKPYVDQLSQLGLRVQQLPLFGNVSIESENADSWLFKMLNSEGVPISANNREGYLLAGIFGSLQAGEWQLESLLNALRVIGDKSGKVPVLILCGRRAENLNSHKEWMDALDGSDKGVRIIDIGAQASNYVSQFFNSIDLGVATTTLVKMEKSGAFIAMLEHGLPVLSVNSALSFRSASTNIRPRNEGVFQLADALNIPVETLLQRRDRQSRVEQVAERFMGFLGNEQGK